MISKPAYILSGAFFGAFFATRNVVGALLQVLVLAWMLWFDGRKR